MTLRFIHTSDWHIAKPLKSFGDDELSANLRAARLNVIDHIGQLAGERKAEFVLVAGDTFDAEVLPRVELLKPLFRMGHFSQVTWVVLPGNHDPGRPGGVWDRVEGQVPSNVIVCREACAYALNDRVEIWPSPLAQQISSHDPTHWMTGQNARSGRFRIGLAHGSVNDFGTEEGGAVNAPIDWQRAERAGLDYLALGDWHGTKQISPRTWYSGTPEPDNFHGKDQGQVLDVCISEPGAEPQVEKVQVGTFHWVRMHKTIGEFGDLDLIERQLTEAKGIDAKRVIARVNLDGGLAPADFAKLEDWIDCQTARLGYLDLRSDSVVIRADDGIWDILNSHPELAAAGRDLQSQIEMNATSSGDDVVVADTQATNTTALNADLLEGGLLSVDCQTSRGDVSVSRGEAQAALGLRYLAMAVQRHSRQSGVGG